MTLIKNDCSDRMEDNNFKTIEEAMSFAGTAFAYGVKEVLVAEELKEKGVPDDELLFIVMAGKILARDYIFPVAGVKENECAYATQILTFNTPPPT